MKKILVIDDLRNFREGSVVGEIVYARTSVEALDLLSKVSDFDEIWFDHDLGEPDGVLDSTMPVVDWLSEQAFNDTPYQAVIYVHTSNPVGRKNIVSSLARWGYNVINVDATTHFIV